MASSSKKCKELTLKDKIELIKASDSHGLSQRQLAERFDVSKALVQSI